jgi:hypothetical protein
MTGVGIGPPLSTQSLLWRSRVYPDSIIQRFWPKVDTSGDCWLWTACTCKGGYGCFCLGNSHKPRQINSHRFVWEITYGPIPAGLCVLHRCDTPACVRPTHLFLGTTADNIADKMAKGRARGGGSDQRGENNNGAKLTEATVRQIRQLRAEGYSYAKIAAQVGTSSGNCLLVCKRVTWQFVD